LKLAETKGYLGPSILKPVKGKVRGRVREREHRERKTDR